MSLKLRLFLFFGSLMALLMLTQWWLVRRISANTVEEFANATLDITQQMVDFFNQELGRNMEAGEMVRVIRTTESQNVRRSHLPGSGPGPGEGEPEGLIIRELQLNSPGPEQKDAAEEDRELPVKRYQATFEFQGERDLTFPVEGPSSSRKVAIRVAGPAAEKEFSVSSDQLQASLGRFRTQLILGTAMILVVGLVAAGVLANRVSRPLQELSTVSAEIASGNWGKQVRTSGMAELETAIRAFNRMSRELQSHVQAQEAWQQERHLSELGEVARSLAHTIRNPLNALGLCLDELGSRPSGSPDSEELVRAGRLQIQRIDQWIRSFLALASQSGALLEPVRWQPLIEDIVLELSQTSSQHSIQVDSMFSRLPPVEGIEAEIRGMLQALLANAVDASPEGGSIEIRGGLAGEKVRVEVVDQGNGLPDEVREHLFSAHVTTKANGSGMGLYLTKQIAMTRYQGELEIDDNPGGGTCACLTLSLRRASP